jgi:hypothetical protein
MPSFTAAGFEVQAKPCKTCIYRKDSPVRLDKLEADIADGRGWFHGWRVCHHSDTACCRGFWNRHRDRSTPCQLAQRLGMVVFVTHDDQAEPSGKEIG